MKILGDTCSISDQGKFQFYIVSLTKKCFDSHMVDVDLQHDRMKEIIMQIVGNGHRNNPGEV